MQFYVDSLPSALDFMNAYRLLHTSLFPAYFDMLISFWQLNCLVEVSPGKRGFMYVARLGPSHLSLSVFLSLEKLTFLIKVD